jgi:hypothetical protein
MTCAPWLLRNTSLDDEMTCAPGLLRNTSLDDEMTCANALAAADAADTADIMTGCGIGRETAGEEGAAGRISFEALAAATAAAVKGISEWVI